ncbi:MAG: hypothetical protein LBR72_05505 [Oscillospiraceae bacterium]|jgi:hypothetical protein|nr:hypothetical protein [Oscillospiraceae bacterium]
MNCPFRIDSQYPYTEGENWTFQKRWDVCVTSECPFYADGECGRVRAILAQKTYYETVTQIEQSQIAYYDAGKAFFDAAIENMEQSAADTGAFRQQLIDAILSLEPPPEEEEPEEPPEEPEE